MINNGDHEVKEPLVEAKRHFERGCDLGDGDSCGNATVLWLKEGLKDPERAAHWAKKGTITKLTFEILRKYEDIAQWFETV